MDPLFLRRLRGKGILRAGEVFYCAQHDIVAKGRAKRTKFLL
jgi:hypothetical protein